MEGFIYFNSANLRDLPLQLYKKHENGDRLARSRFHKKQESRSKNKEGKLVSIS
ncbi:hypothetical protein QUB60_16445 [Microcoleus sp. A2-C5]|uniref:hypothetical protein n=1 Tax=Microcoleus sp. A2-C2 TaxID=2818530 RepID=UPI002FD633BB